MKKVMHAKIAMTGICILLGIIIGIQLKTVKKQVSALDIQRVNEISVELKKVMQENENLTEQLNVYEDKVHEYEESMANESETFKLLRDELEEMKVTAGTTEMAGRGITVTLNDSRKNTNNDGNIDSNAFLVHAEDILSIINELNVAGAEAVSINDQRIIGSSSVRCAGSVVNINGIKIATPFIVTAIGNPDVLESALKFPGGVVDSLAPWGIEITIKKLPTVNVPAYNQAIKFEEAKPVEKGGS